MPRRLQMVVTQNSLQSYPFILSLPARHQNDARKPLPFSKTGSCCEVQQPDTFLPQPPQC